MTGFSAVENNSKWTRATNSPGRLSHLSQLSETNSNHTRKIANVKKASLISTSDWRLNGKLQDLIANKRAEESITREKNSLQVSDCTNAQPSQDTLGVQLNEMKTSVPPKTRYAGKFTFPNVNLCM